MVVERHSETVLNLLSAIRAFCASNSDPQIAAKYARYFTEGYDPYGLSDNILGPKRKEWFEKNREELGLEGFLELSNFLWESGKYEEGFLAIHFVGQFQKEFGPETT